MSDDLLSPATHDELVQSLSYALRFDGRGRAHHRAAELIAHIAAERMVEHLERSGYVVLKRHPAPAPTTSGMPLPGE